MEPELDVSLIFDFCQSLPFLASMAASSVRIDAISADYLLFRRLYLQEGAELEEDANDNEEIPDVEGEGDEKQEQEAVERPRKTSKYMTKYERARILGTRAVQIRLEFL